jgi:hypothetical protein
MNLHLLAYRHPSLCLPFSSLLHPIPQMATAWQHFISTVTCYLFGLNLCYKYVVIFGKNQLVIREHVPMQVHEEGYVV